MNKINVGLIGFGTIGSGVVKVLQQKAKTLEKKLGLNISLAWICDLDIESTRGLDIDRNILTSDVQKILNDQNIQIVVELIGGIHPAKEFILQALKNKKFVVTANKALLAEEGAEIFEAAKANGVDVYYEASVGGAIPIIRTLREGLVADRVETVYGIINGTSNYILSQMAQKGCDFKIALREAQKKGYAESDPSLDINGGDSAHKIAILARLSFGHEVDFKDVYVEGIENIDLCDIRYAAEMGYCIKLLAIAKKSEGSVQLRVHPTLLPKKHILANVDGVSNAILLRSDFVGEQMLHGPGAGQLPTASAVVSDIISIAQKMQGSLRQDNCLVNIDPEKLKVNLIDNIETRYYFRFSALDEPAVLSQIAAILGKNNISIYSVIQKGRRQEQSVHVVMMTHDAKEKDIAQALLEINNLPVIKRKSVAIRTERI
ncbi:MAG: homoserine dehydrogenase [Candidatus Omnitrophica bacterium]|nr:homoserine dehydrogenase [Candidatus Omnitrophota bacterium]